MSDRFEPPASPRRRRLVNAAGWWPVSAWVAGCGGGAGSDGSAAPGGAASAPGGAASAPGGAASAPGGTPAWALGQVTKRLWDFGSPSWAGGNAVTLANVQPGATLVLVVWGFQASSSPQHLFPDPTDSLGQPIAVAADAGHDARIPVQLESWVLHNAQAGSHTWSNLPDLTGGDGCLFFIEFRRPGAPSGNIVGAATNTISVTGAPFLSSGSVTMSTGANPGDLLVACSFEEEFGFAALSTAYTDPPAGWSSIGVQNESTNNIAGEVCWRLAPDTTRQTVAWSWSITGNQDPVIFKGVVFSIA